TLPPLASAGHVSAPAALGIWAVIIIVQCALSTVWLHFFRYGHLEWLWRCGTYWELTPLRSPEAEPSRSHVAPPLCCTGHWSRLKGSASPCTTAVGAMAKGAHDDEQPDDRGTQPRRPDNPAPRGVRRQRERHRRRIRQGRGRPHRILGGAGEEDHLGH